MRSPRGKTLHHLLEFVALTGHASRSTARYGIAIYNPFCCDVLCCIILNYVMLLHCCVVSLNGAFVFVLHYVILYCIMLCCIMPYEFILLQYVTYHIMVCYVSLYVILNTKSRLHAPKPQQMRATRAMSV